MAASGAAADGRYTLPEANVFGAAASYGPWDSCSTPGAS